MQNPNPAAAVLARPAPRTRWWWVAAPWAPTWPWC